MNLSSKPRPSIFTITSLYIKKFKDKNFDITAETVEWGRERVVGFYTDLNTARKCVIEDWGAFEEAGYYNHIVIEKVVEGLYNIEGTMNKPNQWWFRFDGNERKWVECVIPNAVNHVINISVG